MIKMSKILAAVAVFITVIIAFGMLMTGCQTVTENEETSITLQVVNKEPIEVKYEPPHYDVVTTYEYQWDWWNSEYKLLPIVKNEYVEEKFNI